MFRNIAPQFLFQSGENTAARTKAVVNHSKTDDLEKNLVEC